MSRSGQNRKYHEDAKALGVVEALRLPTTAVFAFQEMNRQSGSPQNDKHIFTSVTSLMKAQAHELSTLPQRKKDPVVYQFNLLSVMDTDLVRLDFDGSSITASPIETEHYIAQYIIQKKDSVSRIHFVAANKLEPVLADYGRLHSANCKLISDMCDEFYHDIFLDQERAGIFLDEIRKDVDFRLWYLVNSALQKAVKFKDISLALNDDKSKLVVHVPWGTEEDVLTFLNSDTRVQEAMSSALKRIYRYEGAFSFEEDPFPF